jgi:RNA polymerase sigma factor (sigma-70 family)
MSNSPFYERILQTFGPALSRVAAGYEADPALREDLFQDICLALWRALPQFRGESSERTFVFRIAHNRGLRHSCERLTLRCEQPSDILDQLPAEPESDPESQALAGDRHNLLLQAVRSLPALLREVVILNLEGLGQREIAEVLGIEENNVGVRLHRARAALRVNLTQRATRTGI